MGACKDDSAGTTAAVDTVLEAVLEEEAVALEALLVETALEVSLVETALEAKALFDFEAFNVAAPAGRLVLPSTSRCFQSWRQK